MHRALVAPDKFRGTLTAVDAATAMRRGLRRAGREHVATVPMADGGEGTLDAILAATGGKTRPARVTGPLGEPVDAVYGLLADGTAVVEMARASGLALVARNDPLRASTRGTGELIRVAASGTGTERIVVGVGGSATTDGGLGAVEALHWSLQGREVVVACDVTTRFLDAAEIFGRQKGATAAQVALLTRRLEQIAQQYEARTGIDVRALPGSGAAGGLAGGLAALGARLEPGFEIVADAVGLDEAMRDRSVVVTGEGTVDMSSMAGKVVGGVLDLAEEIGVERRVVIGGQVSAEARAALEDRGAVVLALVDRAFDLDDAFSRAAVFVEEAVIEAVSRA